MKGIGSDKSTSPKLDKIQDDDFFYQSQPDAKEEEVLSYPTDKMNPS